MQLQALFLPAPMGVNFLVLNAQKTRIVAPLANARDPLLMTRSSSSSSTEDEKETGSTSCKFGRVACYLLGTGRGSGHKIVR